MTQLCSAGCLTRASRCRCQLLQPGVPRPTAMQPLGSQAPLALAACCSSAAMAWCVLSPSLSLSSRLSLSPSLSRKLQAVPVGTCTVLCALSTAEAVPDTCCVCAARRLFAADAKLQPRAALVHSWQVRLCPASCAAVPAACLTLLALQLPGCTGPGRGDHPEGR